MDNVHPTSPRRVKVYTLEDDKWIDRGTGYCSGVIEGGPHFLVKNENDTSETLLKATIEGNTQYQRQQDTLIVWTDHEGNDYALSFQEPDGCLSLCEFLINIQHSLEPNISLVAVISNGQDGEITEVIAGPVPEPCLPTDTNLAEVIELLNQGSKSNKFKELLVEFIETKNYLGALIETFERNEKTKNLTNLYYLCDIVKTLVFYNDSSLLETFLNDDVFIGIVGIFEYDPEFSGYKTNNREYLTEKTTFKEVIPIDDEEIKSCVKKTFRLQFLKDVVLARLLDDSTLGCISTMIHLNEDKILTFIKDDKNFLPELFSLYETADTEVEKKRDGIKMLHQFTLIAKKFQQTPRSEFYKSLIDRGFFKLIQFAFDDEFTENRILATELIVAIIEHDVMLFNKTEPDNEIRTDMTLLIILIDVLLNESNIGLKTQAFEALKVLLDPANIGIPTACRIESSPSSLHDSIETGPSDNSYLQSFYKTVATKLFGPLITLDTSQKISKTLTITYSNLLELLSFVSREHDRSMCRSFVLENRIMIGVSKLLGVKYSCQLRLTALRCLKMIILLDDEFYTRFIVENDLLREFVCMVSETKDSNNLMSSSCLSLLNLILQNRVYTNFRRLQNYLVLKYLEALQVNPLGKELILTCETEKGRGLEGEDGLGLAADDDGSHTEDHRDDDDDDDEKEIQEVSLTSPDPPEEVDYELNTNNIHEEGEEEEKKKEQENVADDAAQSHETTPEKRVRTSDMEDENLMAMSPEKRKKLSNIISKAGKIFGINSGNTSTVAGNGGVNDLL